MKCRCAWIWLVLACSTAGAAELRVCADPNNLPFSNRAGAGFENKIVELLARDLGANVSYTWWAQRRGSLRNTLQARKCDVVPGIATGIERVATTHAPIIGQAISSSRGRMDRMRMSGRSTTRACSAR